MLLIFSLSPTAAFCNIKEVSGLNIKEIFTPLHSPGTAPPPSKYLDELMATCKFHGTHTRYDVKVSFEEDDNSNPEDDSEMTNTDLESMGMEAEAAIMSDQALHKEPILLALNTPLHENDSKKKYLLRKDEISWNEDSSDKRLRNKLAQDAYHIANAHTSAITRSATTCLCVVIVDEYDRAKKFVFHNGKEKMNTPMAQKAEELGYGIRTGYQSHAEGAFMQFLLQRGQQNHGRYTHILGMGCSRMHCQECDYLLKLFLGSEYYMCTAAMQEDGGPIIANTQEGCINTINARTVYGNDAIRKGRPM